MSPIIPVAGKCTPYRSFMTFLRFVLSALSVSIKYWVGYNCPRKRYRPSRGTRPSHDIGGMPHEFHTAGEWRNSMTDSTTYRLQFHDIRGIYKSPTARSPINTRGQAPPPHLSLQNHPCPVSQADNHYADNTTVCYDTSPTIHGAGRRFRYGLAGRIQGGRHRDLHGNPKLPVQVHQPGLNA